MLFWRERGSEGCEREYGLSRREVQTEGGTGEAEMTSGCGQIRTKTAGQYRQLVSCRLDELRRHPSYVRHHLTVPASQLSALTKRCDLVLQEPLAITRDRTILDGYARVELARHQGRLSLPCVEYEEALRWLLQMHRGSDGLNAFSRGLLALDLEPWLREKALSNQRAGGENKGSSKLTEAVRVDVRAEIAHAAGVCEANITKVKQLMPNAHPEILDALRSGEVRIHRAWKWSKESPDKQLEALRLYRNKRGVGKTIRDLISHHKTTRIPTTFDLANLIRLLSALNSVELGSVSVLVVKAAGKAVYVTEEFMEVLEPQEELTFACATKSH